MTSQAQDIATLKALLATPVKVGETWFVLSKPWWKTLCQHVGLDPDQHWKTGPSGGPSPSKIDNSSLLATKYELRPDAVQDRDYILVHSTLWDHFLQRYGGGPAVERPVVSMGNRKEAVVDVSPKCLLVGLIDSNTAGIFHRCELMWSRYKTLADLLSHFEPRAQNLKGNTKRRVWVLHREAEGPLAETLYKLPLESPELAAFFLPCTEVHFHRLR
jgi:hypothetical protein